MNTKLRWRCFLSILMLLLLLLLCVTFFAMRNWSNAKFKYWKSHRAKKHNHNGIKVNKRITAKMATTYAMRRMKNFTYRFKIRIDTPHNQKWLAQQWKTDKLRPIEWADAESVAKIGHQMSYRSSIITCNMQNSEMAFEWMSLFGFGWLLLSGNSAVRRTSANTIDTEKKRDTIT